MEHGGGTVHGLALRGIQQLVLPKVVEHCGIHSKIVDHCGIHSVLSSGFATCLASFVCHGGGAVEKKQAREQ